MAEVCVSLHWCGGMRRLGVCARRMSGCFYNLVGMTKSTMVVVKSTNKINELGALSTTSRG